MGMHPTFTNEDSFILADLMFSENRKDVFLKMINMGLIDSSQVSVWEKLLPSVSEKSHSLAKLANKLRVLTDPIISQLGYMSTDSPIKIVKNITFGLNLFNNKIFDSETVKGMKVLDFGCGIYRPLSVAIILCANGFERAYAFEPYPIDTEIPYHAAIETVNQIMQFPSMFNFTGIQEEAMFENLSKVDFRGIKKKLSDFDGGRTNRIDLGRVVLINDLNLVSDGDLDLIISNAVLEHVADFGAYTNLFFTKLSASGVCLHLVDFVDHRYYDDNSLHPYEKYYDGVLHEINGLLPSEMEQEFLRHGFGVKKAVGQYVPIDFFSNKQREISGKYRHASMEELREHVNYYYLEKNGH